MVEDLSYAARPPAIRGRRARPRPGFGILISLIVAVTSAAWTVPDAAPGASTREREPDSQVDLGGAQVSALATTFDSFNRTIAPGYSWGTASSGAPWVTSDNAVNCPGYTTSVNGQAGVMTGSAGATCDFSSGVHQEVLYNGARPWEAASWTLTGQFRSGAIDGSQLGIRVRGVDITNIKARLILSLSSTNGQVQTEGEPSVPFTWQANTWYSIKWVVVWGSQERVKIWPSTDAEPSDWLSMGGVAAGSGTSGIFGVTWRSVVGATSVNVDDLAFGPAPILPPLPPPPDTEFNPPYVNGDDAGDPVSTFTGTYSDAHLDVAIPGRGPAIQFARAYNSNDTRVTTLGPGWTHSYNIELTSPDDGTNDVVLVGPQGRSDRYLESGGLFVPPTGVHRALVRNPDETYTATDRAQTEWRFDPNGRLTQIRDRFGNASSMTYDTSGRLSTVSDPAGRGALTLGYTGNLLTSVTDWASPARSVGYQYDPNGRLWKVTDREGKITTFGYDGTSARITTVTDARGNVALTTTYDAQGRVETQKDARGLITGDLTTFAYVVNADGSRQTTLTLPTTSFEPAFHPTLTDTYDPNGWLVTRVTAPSSSESLTQSFTYDGTGNRTSATDPRGNTTNFCYDVNFDGTTVIGTAGNLTRVIRPAPAVGGARPTSLIGYDVKNNVIRTVPPRGVPSGQTVTCATDLSSISTAYTVDYSYDAAGAMLLATTARFTDPNLGLQTATTKYEYSDPLNLGLVTRVIPPRGNTGASPDYSYATTLTYYTSGSSAGQLSDITDALGNRRSFQYDAVGRLTFSFDALAYAPGAWASDHYTSYGYDKEDRLVYVILPAPTPGGSGLLSQTRYNEVGKPSVRIDANGQVSTFAYDERNSLFQVKESPSVWTDPANQPVSVITTEYTYDAGGNVTRVSRAKGDGTYERATDYAYDGRGLTRLESQYPAWPSTAGPLVTSSTYDPAGNLLTRVDPLGQTTSTTYDALNRVTGIDYSNAGTPDVAYGYDGNGNRTSMADGTGTTTYAYDEADQLTSVTTQGPKTVGYRYDIDGNRTKLIYPDATAVTYTFNKASQLASLLDWASRSVSYTYAADGLVASATYPDASLTTYTYDNARRLIDIVHAKSSGQQIDRFFYGVDPVGNVTSVANGSFATQFARPDGLASSNGTWVGTFDGIDEVVPSDLDWLNSPLSPTSSNYYEVTLSNVSPPLVTTGTTFRYRYSKSGNDSGKTINLTVELRQGTTVIASQTQNNIPGSAGSGWQQAQLVLTSAQSALVTNVADLRLRFRPVATGGGQGRYAQISWAEVQLPAAGDPASQFTYGYDRLYRLTSVAGPDGPRSYTYDPAGNRLTKVAGASTAYTYDRADRILSAGATSLTVDANGNLVAKGADTFAFDQANRLTAATVAGATERYAYDGDGTRFSRQVGTNPPIRYVTDVTGGLPTTIDDSSRKYVYGLDLAYAVTGSSIEVYHPDRLGSVRALTNASGSVTATYRTDEWGIPTVTTGSSAQPFGFTGEPKDATGLSYLRARYYDPTLGRFTSRDTWTGSLANSGSQNRFAYVAGNPTTRNDPSGRCFVDTFADAAFIAYDLLSLAFGPAKEREGNWLAFGADLGGAALPCVTGAGIIVRLGRAGGEVAEHIALRLDALIHIAERHLPGGALTEGASVFDNPNDLLGLVRAAESAKPVLQANENFARIVDAGRQIGTDRVTGGPTSIYTVITDAAGSVVTMFPGTP